MELRELIQAFIETHNLVTSNKTNEDKILSQIIDIIKATFPNKHVDLVNNYITIGQYTRVSQDEIKLLQDLGIKNFFIDTHLEIVTHYLKIPTYYNNLTIYIDIDDLDKVLED